MQGTPHKKKARFSEYPQVFQYSSKNKKQGQGDNDSLLLDSQCYSQNQKKSKLDEEKEGNNGQIQLQIDQITSGLEEIEAYLQQDTKPVEVADRAATAGELTPSKQLKKVVHHDSYTFALNPQLRSGRQTMSYEQELKVKQACKQLVNEISNNNKKNINQQQNKQKTIQQRIQNQIKKNKRITMDTQDLMNMLNDYKNQFQCRKFKDDRKNRITIDVFALTKLIENAADEQVELEKAKEKDRQQQKVPGSLTPLKKTQKQVRKSKVFSTFKQSPHEAEIKLYVASYLSDVGRRLQQKCNQNKKISQLISELKSELGKIQLKISDARKRVQKNTIEKGQLDKKIKIMNVELNKRKYLQDCQSIRTMENKLMIKVLKLNVGDDGCYGHFIFNQLFLKAKSKCKIGPTELKFMIPQQVKQNQKYFLISTEDCINMFKKYHSGQTDNKDNFLQAVINAKKAYLRLKKLDRDLYYLSLNFQLRQFELSPTLDKLSFQIGLGGNRFVLFEINMSIYISNQNDNKSILIYDPQKPGYLNIENEIKVKGSIIFQKIKNLINVLII